MWRRVVKSKRVDKRSVEQTGGLYFEVKCEESCGRETRKFGGDIRRTRM